MDRDKVQRHGDHGMICRDWLVEPMNFMKMILHLKKEKMAIWDDTLLVDFLHYFGLDEISHFQFNTLSSGLIHIGIQNIYPKGWKIQ